MSARSYRDARGRPLIAVTGIGVVSSLGQGQADTWAAMSAGRSGIHTIARFSTEGLRTRIAGTVDFLDTEPLVAPLLYHGKPPGVARGGLAQAGNGTPGGFSGGGVAVFAGAIWGLFFVFWCTALGFMVVFFL